MANFYCTDNLGYHMQLEDEMYGEYKDERNSKASLSNLLCDIPSMCYAQQRRLRSITALQSVGLVCPGLRGRRKEKKKLKSDGHKLGHAEGIRKDTKDGIFPPGTKAAGTGVPVSLLEQRSLASDTVARMKAVKTKNSDGGANANKNLMITGMRSQFPKRCYKSTNGEHKCDQQVVK
uniref:Uncharacterized protein n=1 Tax=Glossina brevipalpis TaxID=37001 RepID=A0A1A9W0Y1_9MUSC